MRLFEFEDNFENDPMRVATAAALSHIQSEIEDSSFKGRFKTDSLINVLRNYGVRVTRAQLQDLVNKEPWSNLIANVSGDYVVFKGKDDQDSDALDVDATANTLDTMADRASQNQQKGL
jgi:hypothetical protein